MADTPDRADSCAGAPDRAPGSARDAVPDTAPDAAGSPLRLRQAAEADAEALLYWRNDPDTRRWSRNTDEVEPADHLTWLRGVLASQTRLLLLAENPDGQRVGMVRFDRIREGLWEVSIALAPDHRGRKLARPLLAAGERELCRRIGPGTVRAVVHRDNTASTALFRAAGYRLDGAAVTATSFSTFVRDIGDGRDSGGQANDWEGTR